MKVSIVTGTYNSEEFVGDCIASVNNQTYGNIEHIIIDGASKDTTVSKIKDAASRVTQLISEKDNGIYDAMNKGLKLATGEVIGILNSDDFYNSKNIIQKVVDQFMDESVDIVFGDLYYVHQQNTDKVVRTWSSGPYLKGSFMKGWHPAHPAFFVRKRVYEKYGYFDLEFSLAGDFELMLRFLEKHQLKSAYINEPMVRMRLGGASNKSVKNMITGNKECYRAFKKNNLPVTILYPFIRLIPKLKQYF